MGRVILGLLKGGLIGAAIGAGAFKLGIAGGFLALVVYAVIGGVVGMLCGRPPWRQDTFWTTALKGIFGAIIGGALYWGAGGPPADRHPAAARPDHRRRLGSVRRGGRRRLGQQGRRQARQADPQEV